eukprot:754178-Hanusia_phi.AAC.3
MPNPPPVLVYHTGVLGWVLRPGVVSEMEERGEVREEERKERVARSESMEKIDDGRQRMKREASWEQRLSRR